MLSDTHRFWTMDDTPKDQNQKLLAMWPQLLSTLQNSKESHNNNNKAWNIILGDLENWLPVVPSKFQPFRRSFMDPHVYSPPMNPIFLFFYKVFWLGSRHVFSFINLAPILCPLVRGSFQILAEFWKHCLIFLAKIFWYPLFYCIIPFLFGSRSSLSVFRLHFCPKFFFFFFLFSALFQNSHFGGTWSRTTALAPSLPIITSIWAKLKTLLHVMILLAGFLAILVPTNQNLFTYSARYHFIYFVVIVWYTLFIYNDNLHELVVTVKDLYHHYCFSLCFAYDFPLFFLRFAWALFEFFSFL